MFEVSKSFGQNLEGFKEEQKVFSGASVEF